MMVIKVMMEDGWFDRLCEVVIADKRSLRAISMEAGLGQNYLSQMISDGKAPGTEKLSSILRQFPGEIAPYVLLNIRITSADLSMLHRFSKMKPGAQAAFESFLGQLEVDEDSQKPDAVL